MIGAPAECNDGLELQCLDSATLAGSTVQDPMWSSQLQDHRETVEVTGLLSVRALLRGGLAVGGPWSALALVVGVRSRSCQRRQLGPLGVPRVCDFGEVTITRRMILD